MAVERVLLASPRGFCAGVEKAIKALAWMVRVFEPPVYCYHEIVHNRHVVDQFRAQGVVFVDAIDEVPAGAPLMLSAHGSAPEVVTDARRLDRVVVDAVCPLVTKVHHELKVRAGKGYTVLYVGHQGHEEAVGTMAVAPDSVQLVQTEADVDEAVVPTGTPVALLAQTTLSHDEWSGIMARAQERFPDLWMPNRSDLCFATTNRQAALKAIAGRADAVIVIGSFNSSNTRALETVARAIGLSPGPPRQCGRRTPRRPLRHRRRHRRGLGPRRTGRRRPGPPGPPARARRRSPSPTRTSTSPRPPRCATSWAAWPPPWPSVSGRRPRDPTAAGTGAGRRRPRDPGPRPPRLGRRRPGPPGGVTGTGPASPPDSPPTSPGLRLAPRPAAGWWPSPSSVRASPPSTPPWSASPSRPSARTSPSPSPRLQWVVSAYLLTLAGLLLVGGSLGDRYGRRLVFIIGVATFALTSLVCAVAPDAAVLIGGRALQGVGAALLTPGSLAILRASFARDDQGRAVGAWSGLGGVATAIGPFLGGFLISGRLLAPHLPHQPPHRRPGRRHGRPPRPRDPGPGGHRPGRPARGRPRLRSAWSASPWG